MTKRTLTSLNEGRRESFRDKIATLNDEGGRVWIYPTKPKGRYHRARAIVAAILVTLFFIGPYIRINGHPLLLVNIMKRYFVIFGQPFFPQDFFIFVLAMIAGVVFVLLFTVVYGRLWCGWACPQTIFMEMVFRKIEYLIEGGPGKQKALNKRHLDTGKLIRKALKHAVFFLISFAVSNTFMAYLIGTEEFLTRITGSPAEASGPFIAVALFSGLFYFIFSRFREQACMLVCPYGRIQGALLDRNSIVVTYDWKRGEPRMPLHKAKKHENPGDCINCYSCVKVCPMGIDIHNGTQLECVNCTACMDACDAVMDRVNRPRGLIRYASYSSIDKGQPLRLNFRMLGYTTVLVLLLSLLGYMLVTRSSVETTILRTPGMLYNTMDDGNIRNLYSLKIINKTYDDLPLRLELVSPADGRVEMVGGKPFIKAQGQYEAALFLIFPPRTLTRVKTPVIMEIYSGDKRLERVKTTFMGPVSGR